MTEPPSSLEDDLGERGPAPQASVPEPLPQGRWQRLVAVVAVPVASIVLALIAASVLIIVSSPAAEGSIDWTLPLAAYGALLQGAFGGPTEIINTLVATAPLILTGLAVGVGFKAGLFNIGGTGQVLIGGFTAAVVGAALADSSPWVACPVAVIAGCLAGAFYGFIPGFLKAFTGAHEVVTTIMLNSIAAFFISAIVNDVLRAPGYTFARTADVGNAALPHIGSGAFNIGVLIAFALVPVAYWLLWKTTLGFEIRTVGANPSAARYAGMSPRRLIVLTLSLCGLFAGLAGVLQILGVVGFYPATYGTAIGFDGIAVALLGRAHPVGILFSALLFGAMRAGSGLMQIQADVPIEIIDVIQAVILFFLAADVIVRKLFRLRVARAGVDEVQTVTRSYGEQAVG
ncbi:MAG TPA: ABC transporter permease [Acidimicrobiia bacterium]|nr:ABC transporter permease [Acidimicrobiia bacterium]